jgi:5-hydroxyisourate hydrolase-like protein (transthyretin family)
MKKLLILIAVSLLTLSVYSQTTPPAPGAGHWVIIDTNYTVARSNIGVTKANLYYRNNTDQKITGMQFRIWYDKIAFSGGAPTVALKYSATDQYMQYATNTTEGNITVTLVYTGTNSTFSYADGAAVEVSLTHASESTWNTLDSIKTLKITGTTIFNNIASTNYGNDTTLTTYSYGGNFIQQKLTFKGRFLTTAGDGAKNLYLALEKKTKSSSTWTRVNTYKTGVDGRFSFTETLDTTYWDTRISVKGDTMSIGNILSTADAQKINQSILNQYTPLGFMDCFMVVYYMLCGKDYLSNPYMTDTHHHTNDGYDFDGFVNDQPENIEIVNNYKKYYWI